MASFADLAPGPLTAPAHLTPGEREALQRAPRRDVTRVTVRSYDVPAAWLKKRFGIDAPAAFRARSPDHMFVEYDDGDEQYIYRGGPSGPRLRAQVTPARASPDYGKGERVLFETQVPGTAREAVWPARRMAARIEDSRPPYGVFVSNSNSAVSDQVQDQFGVRVGDEQTPGWRAPILHPAPWAKQVPEWFRMRP